jgi:hypothetical protein
MQARATVAAEVDTLTVLFSGQKPSDVQICGTGNLKLHGLCKGYESQVVIQARATVAPAVDTLTVLCSGEGHTEILINGTGKLKLHGLCNGYGSKVPIQGHYRYFQQWILSLCCVRFRNALTFRYMAWESSSFTACVRATEAKFSLSLGLPLLQQLIHSQCCVRVIDRLSFKYMAQET